MKRLVGLLTTLACVMVFAICSFAGEWKSDAKGWWYVNDNGTYPTSTWQTIGTSDYYFGADGYLLVNTTTPDGFKVNADGAKLNADGTVFVAATTTAVTSTKVGSATGNALVNTTGGKTVVNTSTKKYHYPNCKSVEDIKPENLGYSNAENSALDNAGYSDCKKCH